VSDEQVVIELLILALIAVVFGALLLAVSDQR